MSKPLVSVWVASYFAGDYMSETLDSILMQETDYPYEIVIGDDCSQDNTWDVVCEYAKKYPDIIRAHRNEVNLGLSANVLATKRRCRGKYIVNLSGDDYWIDPGKIQKQADFLENHPDYIGVGSKVEIRYGDNKTADAFYPVAEELGKDFTKDSYSRGVNLPSHGFMVHNIFADPEKQDFISKVYGVSSAIDDLYDPIIYLEFGKIYIMEEATCVYRTQVSKKGRRNFNSSRKTLDKALMILDGYVKLEQLQIPGIDLLARFVSVLNLVMLNAFTTGNFRAVGQAYRQIPAKYKTPWYKGVAWRSFCSVWRTGYWFIKSRFKRLFKNK